MSSDAVLNNMPTMGTSQKFWIEFLELYKQNSCLWDIQSSTYMRRDLRNAAYNVLLDKFREMEPAATLDTVKKKIDVFRTGYRRELRKIAELRGNSLPGTEYKPTLWYFHFLSFLDFYDEAPKELYESDDQTTATETEYIEIPADDDSVNNPVVQYRLKMRKLENKPRKRTRTQEAPAFVSTNSYEIEEDDCTTFCASLKLQMRELDTHQKYIAQKLISDVIFMARTSQLTLDSTINN